MHSHSAYRQYRERNAETCRRVFSSRSFRSASSSTRVMSFCFIPVNIFESGEDHGMTPAGPNDGFRPADARFSCELTE